MRKYLYISAIIIFLDQATKTVAEYFMTLGQSISIMPFFDLTLIYNRGAAFGFLSDQDGWQRWFFLILSSVVAIFLFRWILSLKPTEKTTALSLSLILGGAIGNVIDRIYYGHVIDFLDFYVNKYHWPAFNIADSAIVIGALIMAWDLFINPQNKK